MSALNGRTRSRSSPPAARESALASLAHTCAPRRLLEHRQSAPVVGVRLRVQEHSDVAFGSGDEEGRDVVCADVVEIAGDAEGLGGLLSADLCCVQPPADEYQRKKTHQYHEDYQPVSLGELRQQLPSQCGLPNRTARVNLTACISGAAAHDCTSRRRL